MANLKTGVTKNKARQIFWKWNINYPDTHTHVTCLITKELQFSDLLPNPHLLSWQWVHRECFPSTWMQGFLCKHLMKEAIMEIYKTLRSPFDPIREFQNKWDLCNKKIYLIYLRKLIWAAFTFEGASKHFCAHVSESEALWKKNLTRGILFVIY